MKVWGNFKKDPTGPSNQLRSQHSSFILAPAVKRGAMPWELSSPTSVSNTSLYGLAVTAYLTNYNGYTGTRDVFVEWVEPHGMGGSDFVTTKYNELPPHQLCNYTYTVDPEVEETQCIKQLEGEAASEAYLKWVNDNYSYISSFLETHFSNCFSSGVKETFTCSYTNKEYHYMLYYYDQAGNLVQTLPPEGVDVLPTTAFVKGVLQAGNQPAHRMITKYKYHTLGQLVWKGSPDTGLPGDAETNFIYDRKGRLRLSQNAKQKNAPSGEQFSYTRFDNLGRAIEAGQVNDNPKPIAWYTTPSNKKDVLNDLDDQSFPAESARVLEQISKSYYDYSTQVVQSYTRGRLIEASYREVESSTPLKTTYVYDYHGNVQTLSQYIDATFSKYINYEYDLISGNVKKVNCDGFIHRYNYDADNRLRAVYTSKDDHTWEEEARYFYYKHGPLARVELGQDKVQGQDYYYTLQGWIKGVNMPSGRTNTNTPQVTQDPGSDGFSTGLNK